VHSSTSSTELLEIARIRGVHGLTGLVRVELYWAPSPALLEARQVLAEFPAGERRTLRVQRVDRAPKGVLVKFEGVDDREAAKALGGARLLVERQALPPLEPGDVYLIDLIGYEVLAPDGPIGRVAEVMVNPSVDSVVIELLDGKRAEQALAPPFFDRIDALARRVYLSSRDGLIH
jgi:16S rRNA processing protein RimM